MLLAVSQAAPRTGKVSTETALARQRTPAQLKLETLEKDHERLLRDIARKRASRDSTERSARDASSVLEGRASPIRAALSAASIELKGIFAALLGEDSRLRRRDKARVRRLYLQLFPELGGLDDTSPEADGESSESQERDPYDPGSAHDAGRSRAAADDAREAGYSAKKPEGQRASLLRNIFRRLAIALHPDKVRDVAECATLTAIMKEVTCAYESGDLARLVELERTWLADLPRSERDDDEELRRRTTHLLHANTELRRQLRALSAELKALKQSVPGQGNRRGSSGPPDFMAAVDGIVEEMRSELERLELLRDFAASFLRGDISIEEFLLGPPLGDDPTEILERLIAEALGSMADVRHEARVGRRSRGGRS